MKSFPFSKALWHAIVSAQLSDKDTLALLRFVMHHAFEEDGPAPQLTKATKPLGILICEVIGAEIRPDPEPKPKPEPEPAKPKKEPKAAAAAAPVVDDYGFEVSENI